MANGTITKRNVETQVAYPVPMIDNLDGTFSEQVAATVNVTVSSWKDNGPAWTSKLGVVGAAFSSADASAAAAAVTDVPTVGQHLVIDDLIVSTDTAMTVTFTDLTGTILLVFFFPAFGIGQVTPRSKLKLAVANDTLQVQTDKAGNIAVTALYHSEA